MGWSITGTCKGLTLTVSDAGVLSCHGQDDVHHKFSPIGLDESGGLIKINHELLLQLNRAECAWSIRISNDSDWRIDPNGEGLLERARQAPTRSHGKINFLPGNPDLVGFTMVVPESTFGHIQRLLELVLRSHSLQYSFGIDFGIFRQAPEAQTGTPMLEEFMKGRPAFFNEFWVSVRKRNGKT